MKTCSIIFVFLISFVFHLRSIRTDEIELKTALTGFITQLTNTTSTPVSKSPWNSTSLPCTDSWVGVDCDNRESIKNLTLDGYNFSGFFNPSLLCNVQSVADSLSVLSLNQNNLHGNGLDQVSNCRQLTRLLISGNQFSGGLPDSFSRLNNLKRLDISGNNFSGDLPDLTLISGLIEFSGQDNHFSGAIPNFEFSNFVTFNVSNNNFSGQIPTGGEHLLASSFSGNPDLCGSPLPKNCDSIANMSTPKHKHSTNDILLYSGYILIGFVVILVISLMILKKCNTQRKQRPLMAAEKVSDDSMTKSSHLPTDFMNSTATSYVENSSFSGDQSALVSTTSLVVLDNNSSEEVNALKFENLLKAPAELLGRGKHGSVYKVVSAELGKTLAVKRIKGWSVSAIDFKLRMERLSGLKHSNLIPAIAFYSSKEEKLLVYDYQENGSLFSRLHGPREEKPFDWSNRLSAASAIADALAYMHKELQQYGISHGNLKSSNVLLNKNMESCITEYGLMIDTDDPCFVASNDMYKENSDSHQFGFKADVYGYGVILLEMLTGKNMIQSNGLDLASWVVSVLKEEWTVEVFDKTLIREGANEGRMLHLLQIAIKCTNPSLQARPEMNQVALMIATLKDEEERSMDVSGITSMYFQV